jgi:GH25 family lysozyme M1 (1,4-beta-N-acetylmuramidase)
MPEGVDLYEKYNKVTDWQAVRKFGIEYAWIKLSDGLSTRDDVGYVAKAKSVGILTGGYHYAQPGDPIAQADLLLSRCSALGALELAPALDLEDPFVPNDAAVNFAIAFLRRIESRGHVPCLYANNSMLAYVLPRVRAAVPNVKVWAARYGGTLTVPYDVHQYTSTGRVTGIVGDVDRNRGAAILNTPTPTAPAIEDEEEFMLVPATHAPAAPAGDDYIDIPCNGKTLFFVATSFGRHVDVKAVLGFRDDGSASRVGMGDKYGPVAYIGPNEAGPIKVEPGTRVVKLRYSADHAFTAWCA